MFESLKAEKPLNIVQLVVMAENTLNQPLPPDVLARYQYVKPVVLINKGNLFSPFHQQREQSLRTGNEFQAIMAGPHVGLTTVYGPTQPLIALAAYVPYSTEGTNIAAPYPTDEQAAEMEAKITQLPQNIRRKALFHHFHPGHGVFLSPTDLKTAESLRKFNVARGPLLIGVSDPTRTTNGIFRCETTIFYWDGQRYVQCWKEK